MKNNLDILQFEKEDYQFDMTYIKEHIKVAMPMAFF